MKKQINVCSCCIRNHIRYCLLLKREDFTIGVWQELITLIDTSGLLSLISLKLQTMEHLHHRFYSFYYFTRPNFPIPNSCFFMPNLTWYIVFTTESLKSGLLMSYNLIQDNPPPQRLLDDRPPPSPPFIRNRFYLNFFLQKRNNLFFFFAPFVWCYNAQEPEDVGPTRMVGYFIFCSFVLSIILQIILNTT